MSLFVIFTFPAIPSPRMSRRCRGRNPDDRCWHLPEDIAGDTAGGTSWEKDKVREEQIPEQRRMVIPSVAQGYRLCYTREYRQGG
ncbi:unnamed protein product, partial [Staurois parvus]